MDQYWPEHAPFDRNLHHGVKEELDACRLATDTSVLGNHCTLPPHAPKQGDNPAIVGGSYLSLLLAPSPAINIGFVGFSCVCLFCSLLTHPMWCRPNVQSDACSLEQREDQTAWLIYLLPCEQQEVQHDGTIEMLHEICPTFQTSLLTRVNC